MVTLAGYTAVTFASGAMADWFPTFLERYRDMTVAEAGGLVGTVTVAGGLGGTICGGLLADRLRSRTRQPYLATSAVSMLGAVVFAALAMQATGKMAITASIFGAQFLMWFYNGPVNTILANTTSAALRPRAFALSILCIHLLGDAISPPIVGFISDRTGSLPLGIALVPIFLGIGAAIWAVGWRLLPELEPTGDVAMRAGR
jgi:fucose permease